MKIFLSWSGERSGNLARLLESWLPRVMNSLEPWVSKDIQKGAQWFEEIKNQLKDTRVALVCITSDNQHAPWIQFESGALAQADHVMVATILYEIERHDVAWPLAQFQHTIAVDKEDVRKLLKDLSEALRRNGERTPPAKTIEEDFDEIWWPRLKEGLDEVNQLTHASPTPARGIRELLIDILDRLQAMEQRLAAILANQSSQDKPLTGDPPDKLDDRFATKAAVLHEGYVLAALNLLPPHAPNGDLQYEPRRRESIKQLEEALRVSPGSRRIGIVLARTYVALNELDGAIKILSETLDVRRSLNQPVDKDDAALLFNRGCYRCRIAKSFEDQTVSDLHANLGWQDLIAAIAIVPEFRAVALKDTDYDNLWYRIMAI
jgi:tetratricopeptide (TPR) repeat protein